MERTVVILLVLLIAFVVINFVIITNISTLSGGFVFVPWVDYYNSLDFSAQRNIWQQPQQPVSPVKIGQTKEMEKENPKPSINLILDKQVCYSGESLKATVEIAGGAGEAELKIYGVKAGGMNRVKSSRTISLGSESTEVFDFRMPSCYGCAGVSPGNYKITAELKQNGDVLADASQTVTLKK